jgi:hypothetical protein
MVEHALSESGVNLWKVFIGIVAMMADISVG